MANLAVLWSIELQDVVWVSRGLNHLVRVIALKWLDSNDKRIIVGLSCQFLVGLGLETSEVESDLLVMGPRGIKLLTTSRKPYETANLLYHSVAGCD